MTESDPEGDIGRVEIRSAAASCHIEVCYPSVGSTGDIGQ
jgi:hypothetical protein